LTVRNPVAALCANPACNAELHEGRSALYDDHGDHHFCGRSCFSEWWASNAEVLAEDYRKLNVERCEL
jgi:hypothetical protein